MSEYGEAPITIGRFDDVEIVEFLHYQYLPVVMPDVDGPMRLPRRLECIRELVEMALVAEVCSGNPIDDLYVYVTARRGWASPDNPLNRPGWHCDGFGTTDINYIWWHGSGTRFAIQPFTGISPDHQQSMDQFADQVERKNIWEFAERFLYRLDPFVVHATPEIAPPGEMRSFVKVSLSPYPYNLLGNSHNHLFDYEWKMHDRSAVRNDPTYPEADFIIEEEP